MLRLVEGQFSTAAIEAAFAPSAMIGAMLRFEAALARAQASIGMIPPAAGAAISEVCGGLTIDSGELEERAARAGTPVVPLVRALEAAVERRDRAAARFVHWGATSQDVIDTALVLQLSAVLPLFESDLRRLRDSLRSLATNHAGTPMIGRTLLQSASPITFGVKAAHWHGAVSRSERRLAAAARDALVLQFGGAVGTLSSYGGLGLDLAEAVGRELSLPVPDAPWHAQRDRLLGLASAVAILAGSLGKIAADIALMMQAEVGEVSEPVAEGRGGSSALPHKRNPVGCLVALAAARRTPGMLATLLSGMVQEHERALGGWQAEWPTLPDLFRATGGALAALAEVAAGLVVHPEAMAANIARTRGLAFAEALSMALARRLGTIEARRLAEQASRTAIEQGRNLADVASETKEIAAALSGDRLAEVFRLERPIEASRRVIARLIET